MNTVTVKSKHCFDLLISFHSNKELNGRIKLEKPFRNYIKNKIFKIYLNNEFDKKAKHKKELLASLKLSKR